MKEGYLQWKTQPLLLLSIHPVYRTITTRKNQHMSYTDNTALFLALTMTFGDKATQYVDVTDHHAADGLLLWGHLDSLHK